MFKDLYLINPLFWQQIKGADFFIGMVTQFVIEWNKRNITTMLERSFCNYKVSQKAVTKVIFL